MVVVGGVVSAVQRVGVPVTIHALDPAVVHRTMFQDGFGGSAGSGGVRGRIKLVLVRGDHFSISSWCIIGSHWSQWSAPFQL